MFKGLAVLVSGLSMAMFCGAANAQQLPKSGTIAINSGWKSNGEIAQVGEGRLFGWGGFYGVTFNQRGSGPLHMGSAICSYTLDLTGGAGLAPAVAPGPMARATRSTRSTRACSPRTGCSTG
jgi:hypothetical protein